jgi:nitrate reductase gamma subunit
VSALELLSWARGTGLKIAAVVFLFGIAVRLVEAWWLGRRKDLSVARASGTAGGWRTIFSRSLPNPAASRSPLVFYGGYAFHIGFVLTLLFYAPHVLLWRAVIGFGWPALPAYLIDVLALVSIAALIALLAHRLVDPVRRFLSRPGDYIAWAVTLVPLLSGYLALHRIGPDYTLLLAVHLLSVELLLIVTPFTKLIHIFSFAMSRWYNGAIAGRKGAAI